MDAIVLIKAIATARLIINEGVSSLKAYREYIMKSEKLSQAEKDVLLGEITSAQQQVIDSKFPE